MMIRVVAFLLLAAAMLPSIAMGARINVGGSPGWTIDKVNYTEWASRQKVFVGDWLFFKYDRRQVNVLEVNKTSFEVCNDQGFLKNITKGGRDVYQLMEARPYYFFSSGYCWQGLKFAINVTVAPPPTPPPVLSPVKSGAAAAAAQPLFRVAAAITALIALLGF